MSMRQNIYFNIKKATWSQGSLYLTPMNGKLATPKHWSTKVSIKM